MNETLRKFIETRDRRIAKTGKCTHITTLMEHFDTLIKHGQVIVGGRTSCGQGNMDPTWRVFSAWIQVVDKAKSLGYGIKITPITHKNSSPTRNGGFWDENEYTIDSLNSGA